MSSVAVPDTRRRALDRRAARAELRTVAVRSEPWTRLDLIVVGVVCAVALGGLIIAWAGISGTVQLPAQARWLGLGIASVILGGLAMVGWLVVGLARVGALRRAVVRELSAGLPSADVPSDQTTAAVRLGVAPGMRHYHREDCRLLIDKTPSWGTGLSHAAVGLLPCGICRPPAPGAHR
jgi:hypothetical protein